MPKSATSCRRRGARVVLDTSGPALRHGCAARPFLVKAKRGRSRGVYRPHIRSVGLPPPPPPPFSRPARRMSSSLWARTAPSSPAAASCFTCSRPPSLSRRPWAPATPSWPAPCGRCSRGCPPRGGPVGRHHRHRHCHPRQPAAPGPRRTRRDPAAGDRAGACVTIS